MLIFAERTARSSRVAQRGEVLAVEAHASGGGLQQSVEHAQQRGLAGSGQAHDDEDLARLDVERRVDHGQGRAGAPLDLGAADTLVGERQCGGHLGAGAEDLRQPAAPDHRGAQAVASHCCTFCWLAPSHSLATSPASFFSTSTLLSMVSMSVSGISNFCSIA